MFENRRPPLGGGPPRLARPSLVVRMSSDSAGRAFAGTRFASPTRNGRHTYQDLAIRSAASSSSSTR